jgi:hypothetical protein
MLTLAILRLRRCARWVSARPWLLDALATAALTGAAVANQPPYLQAVFFPLALLWGVLACARYRHSQGRPGAGSWSLTLSMTLSVFFLILALLDGLEPWLRSIFGAAAILHGNPVARYFARVIRFARQEQLRARRSAGPRIAG